MNAGAIAAIVVAVVIILIIIRMVRIVPQARAGVVERLGRYVRTQGPGLTLLLPFVDRMRPLIDLREQVVSFPPQPVITSDNLTVGVDSVIYFQVTDPRAATYEIQNYIQAVEQLTITTLRNVIGSLNLEQALTSRDSINTQLRGVLDEATGPWGIRVARVEIKAIDPPPSIQDAMEQQMRADRNKRALILTAEGQRESAIKTAEGQKAAQILDAEGRKQAAILAAEADRQSRILRAEGERAARYLAAQGQAKAIETTFGAIHAGQARPGAAGLPVPADAAADRAGRRQQDVDRAERVQQGPGRAGQADRRRRRRRAVLAGRERHRRRPGRGTPIDTVGLVRLEPDAGGRAAGGRRTCARPTTTPIRRPRGWTTRRCRPARASPSRPTQQLPDPTARSRCRRAAQPDAGRQARRPVRRPGPHTRAAAGADSETGLVPRRQRRRRTSRRRGRALPGVSSSTRPVGEHRPQPVAAEVDRRERPLVEAQVGRLVGRLAGRRRRRRRAANRPCGVAGPAASSTTSSTRRPGAL